MTVLDEADHLCDLGFYPAVDKLVGLTPAGSQRMLLSATLDGDVDLLVRTHLRDPRIHELDPNSGSVTTMTHHTLTVAGFRDKVDALSGWSSQRPHHRLHPHPRGRDPGRRGADRAGLTASTCRAACGSVSASGTSALLHRPAQVVVATDVAARGIHVDDVGLVVHFDAAGDAKSYLHRSGRTARAGNDGCVVTLTTSRAVHQVVRLQQNAGVKVLHHDLRTAPKPMTAEALAEAGHPGPVRTHDARRPQGRPAGKQFRGRSGPRTSYAGRQRPAKRVG